VVVRRWVSHPHRPCSCSLRGCLSEDQVPRRILFQFGGCAGGLSSLRSRHRDWLLLIGITRLKMQLDFEFWIFVLVFCSDMRAFQRPLPPSMTQTVVLATALKPIRVGPIEAGFQIQFHVCSLICSAFR